MRRWTLPCTTIGRRRRRLGWFWGANKIIRNHLCDVSRHLAWRYKMPFKLLRRCLTVSGADGQWSGRLWLGSFFAYKKILGRTETRTRERKYLGRIRSVWDISRGDRARIATCSLRTFTDRFKANYSIDCTTSRDLLDECRNIIIIVLLLVTCLTSVVTLSSLYYFSSPASRVS